MAEERDIFGQGSDPIPGGSDRVKTEDPVVARVRKAKAAASSFLTGQKAQCRKAREYYDLEQWSDADRRKMQTGMFERPAITFDEIKPMVDAVSGIERLNRQDVRFVARALDSPLDDDTAGDLATEAVSAVLDNSHGPEERSRAIKDVAIGGLGFTEAHTDYIYTDDPDGTVMLSYMDWDEMGWDHRARKENLEDSRYFWRDRDWDKEEFRARWPEWEELTMEVPQVVKGETTYRLKTPYFSHENREANPIPSDNKPKGTVTVTQFQWRELVSLYRIVDPKDPAGSLLSMREADWGEYKDLLKKEGQPLPKYVRQQTPVYMQAYVSGGELLEEPIELPKGFTFLACTGLWHKKKGYWYGIVRSMMEPQDVMNKSISSSLNQHLSNAKGGVMFERDAFEYPDLAKTQWSSPDAWIPLKPGGAAKVIQRKSEPVSADLPMFFQAAQQALRRGTGLNEEMIGVAQGETPSNTGEKRIQAGLAVLGWFFDNISRYQRAEARILLEMVREYWTHGQLLEVGGDFNKRAIPLLKDALPMRYLLVVEESMRHSPNLKAQVWKDLQPIIPSLLRFGMGKFLLYILRFAPIPAQLVDMIQREAAQMAGQPQKPGKGGGKQEPPELTAAKVEKIGADTELVKAKTEKTRADRGFTIAKTVIEGISGAQEHEHNMELAHHRKAVDIAKLIKARRTQNAGGFVSGE